MATKMVGEIAGKTFTFAATLSGDRSERHHAVRHGARGTRISVAVLLVTAEHDDVARTEDEPLAADPQFDLAALAGEVLARAGRVRDTGHRGANRQVHPLDFEARDGLRQEFADGDAAARAGRQRGGWVDPAHAARWLDELLETHLQRLRDADQDREGRVRCTRLEVGPGRAWDARYLRDLLLAQAACLAQFEDVAAEVARGLARAGRQTRGHGSKMAPCQWIGNSDDKRAARRHGGHMHFEDKSVLVTGGSRGLGRALARGFADAGARVALVARERAPLEATVAELRAAGRIAYAIVADVADKDRTYAIAGQAAELIGPVDVLVNNASTLGPSPLRPLIDTDCEDLERALAVNLIGAFRLSKAVMGHMLLRGTGLVVNISSDAAIEPYPNWGAYAAAKAGLDQLTRVWGAELAGTGVRVVSIDPGEMDTALHAEALPEADRATLLNPAVVARQILHLLRRSERLPAGARVRAQDVEPSS